MLKASLILKALPQRSLISASALYSTSSKASLNSLHSQEQLSLLKARLDIPFNNLQILSQALTHKSFDHARVPTNERLQWIGTKVLNLYIADFLLSKYSDLSAIQLQDLHQAHFGLFKLAEFAKKFDLQNNILWNPPSNNRSAHNYEGLNKVLGKSFQALIGAIYSDQGALAAHKFIQNHLLPSPIDLDLVLDLDNPKSKLLSIASSKNLTPLLSRILKESTRFTSTPSYLVGLFADSKKIGEGFGSSPKLAESNAAKDSLIRYFSKDDRSQASASLSEASEDSITFFSTL
ncbi:Ribonuclease 3 [Smittium culicis]|uniref:Large ribosomal subunit protein mL44 n=1 Tax=Smittium culicis TaxID=133412 RepID=A0A1R1YA90_9FUNG|nr:Ribonuclease 3 [Smittium culicis]OMJ23851.1 Ribonuclease 3 [Smittium culicis]